jgi:hypothetical protein
MSLAEWQKQLSQALVLPDSPPWCELTALQGLEGSRLGLYQELMFNTVLETLESIFPFTQQLISQNGAGNQTWNDLVEVYRRTHPNTSHKLLGAVERFPQFLAEQALWMRRFPFLSELALYEWLEMTVLNRHIPPAEPSLPAALPSLDSLDVYRPVWNEARILQHFEFPIPEVITALQAEPEGLFAVDIAPQPVDILIYRDPHSLEVRFFTLNGITSLLMQLSTAHPELSYRQVLQQLQAITPALQAIPLETITAQAASLFLNCLETGMLLGSTHCSPV